LKDKIKTLLLFAGFFGFLIGMITGAFTSYKILNARMYNELCAKNDAIWVRINSLKVSENDLLSRIDKLARLLNEYDLAIAQLKVYRHYRETMNVRFSNGD